MLLSWRSIRLPRRITLLCSVLILIGFVTIKHPGLLLPKSGKFPKSRNGAPQIPSEVSRVSDSQNEIPVTITSHPIEKLWVAGHARFRNLVLKQSRTVEDAIIEYTQRYNTLPPPGFAAWVELALRKDFVLIDEFDSLMESLRRFARLPPTFINQMVDAALAVNKGDLISLNIHNHKVYTGSEVSGPLFGQFLRTWLTKDKEYLRLLPNMKLVVNNLDEPKVVVPSSVLESSLEATLQSDHADPEDGESPGVEFLDIGQSPSWPDISMSCQNLSGSPDVTPGSDIRFISAHSSSKDLCLQSEISELHGMLIEPESLSLTHSLVPIWSQAKLSTFQDILFPSPWYSAHAIDYDPTEDQAWSNKSVSLYWSGSTTGGHSTSGTWRHSHRQRLVLATMQGHKKHKVSLLNETSPGTWEKYLKASTNFQHLFATKIIAAIQCDEEACNQQRAAFHIPTNNGDRDLLSASYAHKYALDLDGNGFSGRFYRLLSSRSAVIKQTIFKEWHDDWLIPWVHYIPLSMQGDEVWEMMRWLGTTERGDEVGRSIAEEGMRWAKRVLREVDMELVFLRLLLEYGRLVNED